MPKMFRFNMEAVFALQRVSVAATLIGVCAFHLAWVRWWEQGLRRLEGQGTTKALPVF